MAGLGHVVFYVQELVRSVRFYTEVVGLDPVSYTHLRAHET